MNVDTITVAWHSLLETSVEKSEFLEKICKHAVEILNSLEQTDVALKVLTASLDKIEFTPSQKKCIYKALSKADVNSPQMVKFLEKAPPFKGFAEHYTLRFRDKPLIVPQAELLTYGEYFSSIVRNRMKESSSRFISFGEIESAQFELLIKFMKGSAELEVKDLRTWITASFLSDYLILPELKAVLSSRPPYEGLDDAIAFAEETNLTELDVTPLVADLTDARIEKLRQLKDLKFVVINSVKIPIKAKGSFWDAVDLHKLFPKLTIIDQEFWEKKIPFREDYVALRRFGLSFENTTLDKRAIISCLLKMFAEVTVEGDAGFTLIIPPAGLTLNELVSLNRASTTLLMIEYLVSECSFSREIYCDLFQEYGETLLETGTFVITNSVLEKSEEMNVEEQHKLLKDKGCAMPSLMQMLTLCVLTYIINTEASLFKSRMYYRVVEKLGCIMRKTLPRQHIVIGNFHPLKLTLFVGYSQARAGVAGVRKL